jgi:hypothetical protein
VCVKNHLETAKREAGAQLSLIAEQMRANGLHAESILRHVGLSGFRHVRRLACSFEDGSPDVTFRIDLTPVTDHEAERDMNKCIVPPAYQHIRLSSHSCVNGVLRQNRTIHIVLRRGRYTSYRITRIDIFQGERNLTRFEKMTDFILQEEPDITKSPISRSVRLQGASFEQLLSGALRHHDHRMFALRDPVSQGLQKSIGSVQLERHLGNETEIYLLAGQGGVTADKPRGSSHQFDQANPVDRGDSLNVGAGDSFDRLGKRSFKTKRFIEIKNVVVDGFRDSNDALSEATAVDLRYDRGGAFERAIPTNDKKDVDSQKFEGVYHFCGVLRTARSSEHRDKVEIRSGLADNELVLVGNRAGIQFGQKATGKLIDIPTFD